jgi:hypothetical protein
MRRWLRQEGGGADGYASSSSLSLFFSAQQLVK